MRVDHNEVELLQNGEEYFKILLEALDSARDEIIFEVYIFKNDGIGRRVTKKLIEAARRGVKVYLTIDALGSSDLSYEFIEDLKNENIQVEFYKPYRKLLLLGPRFFKRLHRKIVVIDCRLAFVSGMNVGDDYFFKGHALSKLDYAVLVEGRLVKKIHKIAMCFHYRITKQWRKYWRLKLEKIHEFNFTKSEETVSFNIRDNITNRRGIYTQYIHQINNAKKTILIANSYFFPSHRFIRRLKQASRRGVEVRLLLQGKYDVKLAKYALRHLYRTLLESNIKVYDYQKKILHAKVAVVDHYWSTVGSYNIDPASLLINLEANVFIKNRKFANELEEKLEYAIQFESKKIELNYVLKESFSRKFHYWLAYVLFNLIVLVTSFALFFAPEERVLSAKKSIL